MSTRKGGVQFGRFTVTSSSDSVGEAKSLRRSSLLQGPVLDEESKEGLGGKLEVGETNGKRLIRQEMPVISVSASQLPDPPSMGKGADVLPPNPQSSVTQIHSPKLSEVEELRKVPITLISTLQEALCGGFGEMMDLHKRVMKDSIAGDARRDAQLRMLAEQHLELVRSLTRLQTEHSHIRNRLYGKDKPL